MTSAFFISRWILTTLLAASVLLLWLFWHRLPAPYGSWCSAAAAAGLALGAVALAGTRVTHGNRARWARLVLAGVALALLAFAIVLLTDPFCWRGYATADGSCAWE